MKKQITPRWREDMIKSRLDAYCKYLMNQSSSDILEMVETNTMTVADSVIKRSEDERNKV